MTDLDDPCLRPNFHQCEITDGAPGAVNDCIGVRVVGRGTFGNEGGKLLLVLERTVGRDIGPDVVVSGERCPEARRMLRFKLFDATVSALQRYRAGSLSRRGINQSANRLAGFRIAVAAHGFGRFTKSS